MSGHLPFSLLTLFPLLVLVIVAGVTVRRLLEGDDRRLLLLPAILVLMGQHQVLEAVSLWQTGSGVGFGASEFIETGANVLSSIAVYYGVDIACENRELANQLAESEQRYRTLTEQSPLPVLVSQDGEIVFANRAAAATFAGGDPDALVERELADLRHHDEDGAMEMATDGSDDGDKITTTEEHWLDLDGQEHVVVVSTGRAKYRSEEALYLVCRDVTEREEYRESFERTKSRLETALESSNDAILLIDPREGEILEVNDRAYDLLGYDETELIGLSPYEIHPHETERLDVFFEQVIADEELVTDELSCMRRDGEKIPVGISASTTEYRSRECILAVIRDQTERKKREKQIDVLRRVLRHNLRNDMSVIVGHAEQVMHEGQGRVAELGDDIKRIATSLVDVSDTVRDIQDVVERDRLDPVQIDVATVVDRVATSAREAYPEATIVTDVRPGTTVAGTEMLEEALTELVENAIEHNDTEEPWVEITVRHNDLRRGRWIDVSVLDDGPGIPDHEREVIATDATATPLSHASGMGLWTANQVVRAFGGEMSIDDHADGGSIVTLHLKASQQPDAETVVA